MSDQIKQPSAEPGIELPALDDECSESDVVLRAARWTERTFALIDDSEDGLEGESEAHAGIEAEWELMQRERQLKSEIARRMRAEEELQQYRLGLKGLQ